MDLAPGRPVRITATREETTAVARLPDGTLRLSNGRAEPSHALWPLELEGALLERLALGDLDAVDDFVTRLDILHLMSLREADGLGSFLGGRVRLFPHQLHVAERATANDEAQRLRRPKGHLGEPPWRAVAPIAALGRHVLLLSATPLEDKDGSSDAQHTRGKDSPVFEIAVFDSTGKARQDWAAALGRRPLGARPVAERVEHADWTDMVRRVGARLDPARRPHALAALVVRPVR